MDHSVRLPDQLSAHLKSLRKARGLTQAQLGQRLGVKQVRIAEIEKDPGSISVAQLMQLLSALDSNLVLSDREAEAIPTPAPKRTKPIKGEW
jgi:HTH-type transcriptional regulator/antitoxin HipB